MRVWRIAPARHAAFDGEGARRYGSRWTSRGVPVVFTSATLSLAALERFVHTDPDLEPDELVAIAVDLPTDLRVTTIEVASLPRDWRTFPAPAQLASFGDGWVRERATAALSVPSAVIPAERNYLLNPSHDQFARLTIRRPEAFSFDPRMWKR